MIASRENCYILYIIISNIYFSYQIIFDRTFNFTYFSIIFYSIKNFPSPPLRVALCHICPMLQNLHCQQKIIVCPLYHFYISFSKCFLFCLREGLYHIVFFLYSVILHKNYLLELYKMTIDHYVQIQKSYNAAERRSEPFLGQDVRSFLFRYLYSIQFHYSLF